VQTQTAAHSVSFSTSAMEGIIYEVLTGFHAIRRPEAEVGGVLLGHYEEDRICIDDFEPVLCEHQRGPSYVLTEEDLRGLEETLSWCEAKPDGPRVVGFYRSHTRAEAPGDDPDREFFDRYFPDPRTVFLVLKPSSQQSTAATYFCRVAGGLEPVAGPMPFLADAPVDFARPSNGSAARSVSQAALKADAAAAASIREAAPGEEPVTPRRRIPPPTRPRLTAPSLTYLEEKPPHRDRRWMAALLVLCAGAAAFGFWSQGWRIPWKLNAPAATIAKPSASVPEPAAPAPMQQPPARPATQKAAVQPQSTVLAGVHAMLDQWDQALRSGNPKAIATFYAPKVDSYFGEHNVSSTDVSHSLARSAARYGKTHVLRLSDLHITPIGNDHAVATFHKRWQTSGAHTYSGETEERVTLAKQNDDWKISSEEQTRVLWTERR
jgi:proteasome lid subunit RPN8/RPN11